ncbi:MAG: ABC transporter substrate-binding protein [Coriobacteriia bacterium]|nr:ABC transporter substrate-binding protein [Coriobacteriia bacterium]
MPRLTPRGVLVAAVAAAAIAAILGGCGRSAASAEPHRIGVIVSLTGSYAGLGDPEKNALIMEQERVNDEGGVNGRSIELVFADDGTDEARAVTAASKLIEQDRVVALIGATGTGQSMAIRGDIRRSAVPQVSMAGGTVITDEFDENVFQTPWSNTIVVPFVLDYLRERGLTRVALLTDAGGYGKDGHAIVTAEAPKAGLEIVEDQTFKPGDTDMTAQLTRIKGSDAEVILMWAAGKEAVTVANNREQLGIDLPLVGGPGNARREFIQGAEEAAEGFVLCAGRILVPGAYGEDTEEYRVAADFIERYREKFGKDPDIFAGHAYDAFHIVVEALRRLPREYAPVHLRDEIEATSGFVGIGGTFTFSPTDHNGLSADELVMYRVENGEWVLEE